MSASPASTSANYDAWRTLLERTQPTQPGDRHGASMGTGRDPATAFENHFAESHVNEHEPAARWAPLQPVSAESPSRMSASESTPSHTPIVSSQSIQTRGPSIASAVCMHVDQETRAVRMPQILVARASNAASVHPEQISHAAAMAESESISVFMNAEGISIVVRDPRLPRQQAIEAAFEAARELAGRAGALRDLTLNGRLIYRQEETAPADPASSLLLIC